MGKKLIFDKIQKDNIFCDDFLNFTKNNEIEFKDCANNSIAVIYGPNGTGKTSLAKLLASDESDDTSKFSIRFQENVLTDSSSFFVINDQNGRNIIEGEAKDYLLGDNITKEYTLKKFIDDEFDKLFKKHFPSALKSEFNISSSKSELINVIEDGDIKVFVVDLVNNKSKGDKILRNKFLDKISQMDVKEQLEMSQEDLEKYDFIKNNYADKKSIIFKIIDIKDDQIKKNEAVREIEENDEALKILEKFNYKKDCIVCDNQDYNREALIERKKNNRNQIYKQLDLETKKILEDIIFLVKKQMSDPLNIESVLLSAIKEGNRAIVLELQDEIVKQLTKMSNAINNLFAVCLQNSKLPKKFKEYNDLLNEKPEITDEEMLLIKKIVSENIDKEIDIKRDEANGNNLKILLADKDILGVKLHLSTGEQNFISLAFELLRAKKSEKEIIVLDDPISSFDSIYKNKIAFCIIRFLGGKNQLVLTHNTDLIQLLEHQLQGCFNLYLFNNAEDSVNGFIRVNESEKKILLNLDKLLYLFRNDIYSEIKDEKNFLIAMIPFMRGYANIVGESAIYKELSKVMHGYENEKVNISEIYNSLFSKDTLVDDTTELYNRMVELIEGSEQSSITKEEICCSLFERNKLIENDYSVSVGDILNLDIEHIEILKNDKYPLLNKTLYHTLSYLFLRLKVEKELIGLFNIQVNGFTLLHNIINKAFNMSQSDIDEIEKQETDELKRVKREQIQKQKKEDRIFFTSRKTLLNEFNHFEGNMNIFQPAIDITDNALKKEKDGIIEYLENLKKRFADAE